MEYTVNSSAAQTELTNKHSDALNNDGVDQTMMSDDTRELIEVVLCVGLSGTICFLGSIGNVINIIVFVKQGFQDAVTISLLGLAVADLGALVTLLWTAVCSNPLFRFSNIPFESIDVSYISAAWPHISFTRISSWITVFITFERCMCIVFPMKVKRLITPRRAIVVTMAIFILMISSVTPAFCAFRLEPRFLEQRNQTLLALTFVANGVEVERLSILIVVISQQSSFILVSIFTIVLVQSLISRSKWRSSVTKSVTAGSKLSISVRDQKIVKLVTLISLIFILCFLPSSINSLIHSIFSPEYGSNGRYMNLFIVTWSICLTLEAINSSVNIFVYYNMSSKYRSDFRTLFTLKKKAIEERR